jgi:hypothetical protein
MLYREIICVCSEILKQHIKTVCGQNVEFVNVKPGGTYINVKPGGTNSNHYALKRYYNFRFLLLSISRKILHAFNTLTMRAACQSILPTCHDTLS